MSKDLQELNDSLAYALTDSRKSLAAVRKELKETRNSLTAALKDNRKLKGAASNFDEKIKVVYRKGFQAGRDATHVELKTVTTKFTEEAQALMQQKKSDESEFAAKLTELEKQNAELQEQNLAHKDSLANMGNVKQKIAEMAGDLLFVAQGALFTQISGQVKANTEDLIEGTVAALKNIRTVYLPNDKAQLEKDGTDIAALLAQSPYYDIIESLKVEVNSNSGLSEAQKEAFTELYDHLLQGEYVDVGAVTQALTVKGENKGIPGAKVVPGGREVDSSSKHKSL